MIMPANYSVIAENELTYVEGGAFNFYVDAIDDGGKVMATNIVKWIGNAYSSKVLNTFIGTWFQAEGEDGIKGALKTGIKGLFQNNVTESGRLLDKVQYGITNTIGVASALWVLGTYSDAVKVKDVGTTLSIKGINA
jgi:hypothetical protein